MLGDALYKLATDCFRLVVDRAKLELQADAFQELLHHLKSLGPSLRRLQSLALEPAVTARHPAFAAELATWLQSGQRLKDLAKHLEPSGQSQSFIDNLPSAVALRLAALERRQLSRGSASYKRSTFSEEIVVLLDVASGTAMQPINDDPGESWERLREKWHRALGRARGRLRKLTREEALELIKNENQMPLPQLPARPIAVAEWFVKVDAPLLSDEEMLFWSAEDDEGKPPGGETK